MDFPNKIKAYYDNGNINLHWCGTLGTNTCTVRRKIGLDGDLETIAEDITSNRYVDTPSVDAVYVYYIVLVDQDGNDIQSYGPVFFCYFQANLYAKELKSIITAKLKLDDNIVNVVEDRVYYQSQPETVKYPMVVFSLNEYNTPTGDKKYKDITVPITCLAREKDSFDALRMYINKSLAGFTYKGKEVELHKLIDIGGKAEQLDPGDKQTWILELSFKGRIKIVNL